MPKFELSSFMKLEQKPNLYAIRKIQLLNFLEVRSWLARTNNSNANEKVQFLNGLGQDGDQEQQGGLDGKTGFSALSDSLLHNGQAKLNMVFVWINNHLPHHLYHPTHLGT